MADEETPFHDVTLLDDGFSLPELKWRELLFVGAVRAEGAVFVRDPARPLPRFALPDLFREGEALRIERVAGRVVVRRPTRRG